MNAHELKERTFRFGLRVIRLCESMPEHRTGRTIANQLIRCGTSVSANYRAAAGAKSPKDFIAKMSVVEEECDESLYRIEMATSAGCVKQELVTDLATEANEIISMVAASIKTAKANAEANRQSPSGA